MGKPKIEPLIKQANRFAVLAETDSDDSDDQPDYAPLSPNFGSQSSLPLAFEDILEVKEGQFRVWKNDVTRFSSDTNNIFSSPFSRKRNTKKEEDGWTSIESGPLNLGTAESQEFPSMLNRGNDVADALAWAEKVKASLDKARNGQRRKELSFFRRTVVLDEKF
jgi:hypothetical protein